MTITERIFGELSQRNISQKEFALKINVNEKTVSAWKKHNSLPPADKLLEISNFLDISLIYLITGEKSDIIYTPKRDIDGLYFFARYYLGKEDANIMFSIAGIKIDKLEEKIKASKPKNGQLKSIEFPDEISISPNAFDWISAHCDISPIYFHMKTPISRNDLIEPDFYHGTAENTKTVEEVIKIPEIAEMEREFLKRKREKSVLQTDEPAVQKQQGGLFNKQYEGLMREIIDGYEEIIYQFGGDIGAQFVLLDRFRQAADKLSKEIASRKELA